MGEAPSKPTSSVASESEEGFRLRTRKPCPQSGSRPPVELCRGDVVDPGAMQSQPQMSLSLSSSKKPSWAPTADKPPLVCERLREDATKPELTSTRLWAYHDKLGNLIDSDTSTCVSEAEHSTDSTSTSSTCRAATRKRIPVRLHVYDLGKTSLTKLQNSISKEYGLFHTAVEVYGLEWSFGSRSGNQTGVIHLKPKMDTAHSYRETIEMGATKLSPQELGALIARLSDEWPGHSYDLFSRNCHHFSEAVLQELGVDPLPNWCNSLAGKPVGLSDWFQSSDGIVSDWFRSSETEFDGGEAIMDFFGLSASDTGVKSQNSGQRKALSESRSGARGLRR